MVAKKKNLSKYNYEPKISFTKKRIAIIVSEWNENITGALLQGSQKTLHDFGIPAENIIIEFVPGSFELPTGAKIVLAKHKLDAVICLGCVIKGETKHDEYISSTVARGIMNLSLYSGKPIIFGVLTPNNMEQALERAGGKHGNKGVEAAVSALKMIQLTETTLDESKSIGF